MRISDESLTNVRLETTAMKQINHRGEKRMMRRIQRKKDGLGENS